MNIEFFTLVTKRVKGLHAHRFARRSNRASRGGRGDKEWCAARHHSWPSVIFAIHKRSPQLLVVFLAKDVC